MAIDAVGAWRGLLRAHAGTVPAIESELSPRGLIPLGWYDVLLELNAAPGRRLRMQDLASRVTLSRTRVSRVVDELERSELAVREPDPEDGRACFAVITPKGRAELRRTAPHYLAAIETHFTALLTAEERRVVATALERVADHHAAVVSRAGTRGAAPAAH